MDPLAGESEEPGILGTNAPTGPRVDGPPPPNVPPPPSGPPFRALPPPPQARDKSGDRNDLLLRRFGARMLDGLFLSPVTLVLMAIYVWPVMRDYFDETWSQMGDPGVVEPVQPPITILTVLPLGYYLGVGIALVLYHLVCNYVWGGSAGKKILSLVIVDRDSLPISGNLPKSAVRAAVDLVAALPFVVYVFGLVNLAFILMEGNRSAYDRAAGTRVIRREQLPADR